MMKEDEATIGNYIYKCCMAFKTEQTKERDDKNFPKQCWLSKVQNENESGKIYTNEVNKRQSYAGKTNRILITKSTCKRDRK